MYHRWALRLIIQYDMELQWRPGSKHQRVIAIPWPKTRGATVDDVFPGDITTKKTYRGLQDPVLGGAPLGQLDIEGFNNNNALPLTVIAAVTFTPDLPTVDTIPIRHRPSAHPLDSAPMLPKAAAIGCGEGSSIRALDDIFELRASPTTTGDYWNAPARTAW